MPPPAHRHRGAAGRCWQSVATVIRVVAVPISLRRGHHVIVDLRHENGVEPRLFGLACYRLHLMRTPTRQESPPTPVVLPWSAPLCLPARRWCGHEESCVVVPLFTWKPNNLLSDKDVAISNIAGYCANIRVRHCPCPPVPLPQDARECIRKRHDNCHQPDVVLIIA